MLVPSSSERRCCRSNERVWNKTAMHRMEATSGKAPKTTLRVWGTTHPKSYSPCPGVPGVLRSPRLEVGFLGPGLVDRLHSSHGKVSEGTLKPVSQGNGREFLLVQASEALGGLETKMGPNKLGICSWSQKILVTGTPGSPKSGHCFNHDFIRALRPPNRVPHP